MGIPREQIRWNGWGWTAHRDTLGEHEAVWRWLAEELGMPALLATPARPLDDVTLPMQKLSPGQIAGFVAILSAEHVKTGAYERAFHAQGRSYHDLIALRAGDLSGAPDAVLYPRNEDEVLAILALATREKIAVIPFGGGTGLAGGVTAGPGSVTLDMSRMNDILEIDIRTGTVLAQAGIYGAALEKAVSAKGFTLGRLPDDSEFSSLGGGIASGSDASGLLDLRFIAPQGVLDTQTPSAGPALKHLAPGSEGAFGVITAARVKIWPPTRPISRVYMFEAFSGGTTVLREAAQTGIAHEILQLSDESEARFWQTLERLQAPRGLVQRMKAAWLAIRPAKSDTALLIVRFTDKSSAKRFEALAKGQGGLALEEKAAWLWRQSRAKALYQRDAMLDRGLGVDSLDSVAPWSRIPALYAAVRAALDKAMRDNGPYPGAHGLVLSHIDRADAATARLCFTVLFPRDLENERVQGQAIRRAGIDAIRAHGGSIRAHHGVDDSPGTGNTSLSIAALRGIKAALDPAGIMNPGKLLPPA